MSHLHHDKKLLNRIKRLKGQMSAIEQAIENDAVPCIDILQQVAAARGAINGLMNELVAAHLTTHVLGEDYDQAELDKFLTLLKRYD